MQPVLIRDVEIAHHIHVLARTEVGQAISRASDGKREALLHRDRSGGLPTAEHCFCSSVHPGAELLALSYGKFVDVADDKALRSVVGIDALLGAKVVDVANGIGTTGGGPVVDPPTSSRNLEKV